MQNKSRSKSTQKNTQKITRSRVQLVILLVLCALVTLLPRFLKNSADESRFVVSAKEQCLLACPGWVGETLRDRVLSELEKLPDVSLRDEEALNQWIASVPEACGWIERVQVVQKHYPNQIELRVRLREPAALIEGPDGLHVIDVSGRVLGPAEDARDPLRSRRLPLISLPRPPASIQAGAALRDPSLLEGLAVVSEIEPYREMLRSSSLEVAVVDLGPLVRGDPFRTSDVDLLTTNGLRIEWGRSTNSPRFGALEPSPDRKIQKLLRCASRAQNLEGTEVIQAQFPDERQGLGSGS